MKGEFEVQKQTGQSLIKIDVRNPGDVVGEMALLSRAPRNATLIAKTDGEVLRIPQEAFDTVIAIQHDGGDGSVALGDVAPDAKRDPCCTSRRRWLPSAR